MKSLTKNNENHLFRRNLDRIHSYYAKAQLILKNKSVFLLHKIWKKMSLSDERNDYSDFY